ncbi:MAG: hypothetical protein JNK90_03150 [Planctomycetaceae bacterium]|nr:hypothetical protein [Planctomycetaceae bacterium]
MGWLVWFLAVLIHAAMAFAFVRGFGSGVGAALYSCCVLGFIATAGFALKSSTLNTVTWKNRLAGWFLPWTHWVGGGSLTSLLIKNAIMSILFGALIMGCDRYGLLHELVGMKASDHSQRFSWLELATLWGTVVCWIVLLSAWALLVRAWAKNQLNVLSVLLKGPGNWVPFLLPPAAVGSSITLRYAGFPSLGLLVVAIPLLITTGPVLLMLAVFFWHHLRGKPIRWN